MFNNIVLVLDMALNIYSSVPNELKQKVRGEDEGFAPTFLIWIGLIFID